MRRHRRQRSRSRTLKPKVGDVSVGDAVSSSRRGTHCGEPFGWLSHLAAAANGKQATWNSGGKPHARPQPCSPPKQPCTAGWRPRHQLPRTVFVRLVAPVGTRAQSSHLFIACMLLLAGEGNWANMGALGAPGDAHVPATLRTYHDFSRLQARDFVLSLKLRVACPSIH